MPRTYLFPNSLFRNPPRLCSNSGRFSKDPSRTQLAQVQSAGCLVTFSAGARPLPSMDPSFFRAGLIFFFFKNRSVQS